MQLLKKWKHNQTKTDVYYFEIKVAVFYKHKSVKKFPFFKKIHQFLSDALVTGTKFKLSLFLVLHL